MRRVLLTSLCLLATASAGPTECRPARLPAVGPGGQAPAPQRRTPSRSAMRSRWMPPGAARRPTARRRAAGAERGRGRRARARAHRRRRAGRGRDGGGPDHGEAAIAEADGSFTLDGLAPAPHRLQIDAPGYGPVVVVAQVRAGQVTRSNVTVSQPVMVGEEIVITGTRTPEKRLDSPINVEWVSEKEIQRASGGSMMSALAGVKGLDFANAGVSDQRMSARGFTTQFNSRMLMMLDGRLATLPGNGLPQANLMPATPLDMKSVEVVIGPASALYGPNAHTGVVNVMTKTPWDESGASMLVRGGQRRTWPPAPRAWPARSATTWAGR